MKQNIAILMIGTLVFLLGGCNQSQYLWENSPMMLQYNQEPTTENLLNLAKEYEEAILSNEDAEIMQPGLFADYAVSIALLGYREEANKWFNKELACFGNSASYINKLKEQLIREYLNNTDTAMAELVDLSSYNSDLSNTPQVKKKLTPEEKKALAKEKAKMKKQREKEKKQFAKDKAKQKKDLARQKDKERKAAAKAKEKQKADAAAAKKADAKAKAQAKKEAQAAKEAAEKEKARLKAEQEKARKEAERQAKEEAKAAKKAAENEAKN